MRLNIYVKEPWLFFETLPTSEHYNCAFTTTNNTSSSIPSSLLIIIPIYLIRRHETLQFTPSHWIINFRRKGHADITHRRSNTYHLILQNQYCSYVQVIKQIPSKSQCLRYVPPEWTLQLPRSVHTVHFYGVRGLKKQRLFPAQH